MPAATAANPLGPGQAGEAEGEVEVWAGSKQLTKIAGEVADLRVRVEENPQRHRRRQVADAETRLETTRRRIIQARAKEEAAQAVVARLLESNGGS